jgi:hypothetical protein
MFHRLARFLPDRYSTVLVWYGYGELESESEVPF